MPKLTWSKAIADVAQKYANRCQFEHSSGAYGENLYATTDARSTPSSVVKSWVAERQHYDYRSNSCAAGKTCGH